MMITPFGRHPRPDRRARSDARGSGPATHRGIQIGPKIRVSGTLGKIGQNVKIGAGKVASNPWVQGLVGATLGPGAAAAVGGLGKILDTSRGSVGLGDIAKGAGTGYLAGKGGQLVKGVVSGGTGATSLGTKVKGLVTGGGSDGQGNFGLAGDLAGKLGMGGGGMGGGGDMSLMDKLLMGGGLAAAASGMARKEGFQDRAAQYATDPYDAKAALRSKAIAALSGENAAPDLSGIFANPGSVYANQPGLSARAKVGGAV